MGDENVILAENVLSTNDPGDDTQRRFRYQDTYAGILSVHMLDDSQGISEIFCEFHEDILVKHSDNLYTAIQVKTRDINFEPFTIEDEQIINSCSKFVLLEKKFPNQFKAYSIVSNSGFNKQKPAISLLDLIEKISTNKYDENCNAKTKANTFIKSLATSCDCDIICVLNTLRKLRTRSYSTLEDIHSKLLNQLKSTSELQGATESMLEQIADLILAKHFKASSLFNESETTVNYLLGLSPSRENEKALIESKKINAKEFKEWILSQRNEPVSILLKDRKKIEDIPAGSKRLEIKMDAGGIDSGNIETMRDFKFSLQSHALKWLYQDKKGSETATEKYNQVLSVTKNLCKEVYDEYAVNDITDKGQSMLRDIRSAIKDRQEKDKDVFLDCKYEHILGIVGVLTENCDVWWSSKFEIE